jgi:hypothetical protein
MKMSQMSNLMEASFDDLQACPQFHQMIAPNEGHLSSQLLPSLTTAGAQASEGAEHRSEMDAPSL